MEKSVHPFKRTKGLRILSQSLFFGLFIFVFIRSLDPFNPGENPFLKTDPLILLTHMKLEMVYLPGLIGIILLTLVAGRFFCGWVCPLGGLIDGLDMLLRPLRKMLGIEKRIRESSRRLLRFPPAWFVLGALLVTVFFIPPVLQFFHPNVWIIRIFSLKPLGIFFGILLVIFSSLSRRTWCTWICPLGALYGIIGKGSLFRLRMEKCSSCGRCDSCPTLAADFRNRTVIDHQCILCFDFEHRCPADGFKYSKRWVAVARRERSQESAREGSRERVPLFDASRREFIARGSMLVGGALLGTLLALRPRRGSGLLTEWGGSEKGGAEGAGTRSLQTGLIRPPGVVDDREFVQRCLRCFQCVRSCPNEIIKITGPKGGLDNLFTPQVRFEESGCDYYCQVCQQVCPNYAIPMMPLEVKQRVKMGLAHIDESICVVFAEDTNCLVCEEFCPVPEKAIKYVTKTKMVNGVETELRYPLMDHGLCIGCGICEAYCPTTPRAITVQTLRRVV